MTHPRRQRLYKWLAIAIAVASLGIPLYMLVR
jgi:hypothetical protein